MQKSIENKKGHTGFKQSYGKNGRALKQYQIGVNYVFKKLLLLLRLHKDIDLVLEIFESQGISISKSRVYAWQKKEGAKGFQAMPHFSLESFIDGLCEYKLIDYDEEAVEKNGTLLILRGVPGSGKTTFAEKIISEGKADILIEADQYFMEDGIYKFNPTEIQKAHAWCKNKVNESIQNGLRVIVANTFIKKWEVGPYFKMGAESVEVIKLEGKFKNQHGVPQDKVDFMNSCYERLEKETTVKPQS